MENSLIIGLSRQVALQRKMDVIANNMANMNTSGYKADQLMFEEHLAPVAQMTDGVGLDRRLSYVDTNGLYRDFSAGDMNPTGNPLDAAISGEGWFVAQTEDGDRYTRNGSFQINSEGTLVTADGHPVMGEDGTFVFDASETQITISGDGTISSSAGLKGRLRIVSFENNSQLSKDGHNLYSAPEEAQPTPATEARIMQGMVETSNVKPVLEMTRMIETLRAYTSVSQNLERMSQLREDAIERLGQTNAN